MNRRKLIVLSLLVALCCATLVCTTGEAGPPPPHPPIQAVIINVDPFAYVALECEGPYTTFAAKEKALLDEVTKQGIKPIDVEFALYWNSPFLVKPDQLKWDVAFPVGAAVKSSAPLAAKRYTYPVCASTIHVGPYLTTYHTINALYRWIGAHGHKAVGGPCMERYLDPEPDKVPDAQKRTQILIPVK